VLIPGVLGPHEFFHVMVLVGLAFHWWFLWEVAGGARRQEVKLEAEEINQLIQESAGLGGLLNVQVEKVTKDTAVVRMPHLQKHLRSGGTISGPALMTLADVAMHSMVMAARGPDAGAAITSMTLNFLGRAPAADLVGRGRILNVGEKLIVMEVVIHSAADDSALAQVTGTFSLAQAE
jgi:uncharacterized protein (TIGR00369 family)